MVRIVLPLGFVSRLNNGLLLGKVKGITVTSSASICHKSNLNPEVLAIKPKPWPYETKKFTFFQQMFFNERTTDRFDENTAIISIDGLPGTGKNELGKKLAEELGMHFIPQPTFDLAYVNEYGFDYRVFNQFLPKIGQDIDLDTFFLDPFHPRVAAMQLEMYKMRVYRYAETIAHLLSTGQGVVIIRNPWSDVPFLEAMRNCGYIKDDQRRFYHRIHHAVQYDILHPHMVIYLEKPVSKVMETIKKRNRPNEANSKALTEFYLNEVDRFNKTQYLPYIGEQSVLLKFDSEDYRMDDVIEKIEEIDYEKFEDVHLDTWSDWKRQDEEEWCELRRDFANKYNDLKYKFWVPDYDVTDMMVPGEIHDYKMTLHMEYALGDYQKGFNPETNSATKIMFQWPKYNYRHEHQLGWFPAHDYQVYDDLAA